MLVTQHTLPPVSQRKIITDIIHYFSTSLGALHCYQTRISGFCLRQSALSHKNVGFPGNVYFAPAFPNCHLEIKESVDIDSCYK